MATDELIARIAQSAGGAFRFGRGIVSRSSVVILVFMVAVAAAAFTVPGTAKLWVLAIGAVLFLVWHFSSLWFTVRYPDIALLDGAEWTEWKRWEAAAKGLPHPPLSDRRITDPEGHRPEISKQ